MASTRNYLAFDLGAENGRAIIGSLDGNRLNLTESHRFLNEPVQLPDGLHWYVMRLWNEMKSGIPASAIESDNRLDDIGVAASGAHLVLLDKNKDMHSDPFHCRANGTGG